MARNTAHTVVGRFRRNDAVGYTGAESFRMPGGLNRLIVAEDVCDTAAGARKGADEYADERRPDQVDRLAENSLQDFGR